MCASFDPKINAVGHPSYPSSGGGLEFRPSSSSSSSSSAKASSTSSGLASKVGILRLFDRDVIHRLYLFLNPKELSCFETTTSLMQRDIKRFFDHRALMTDTSEWVGTARTRNPNKWNCLLSQALKDIVMQMKSDDERVKRDILKEKEDIGKDYSVIANQLLVQYRDLINLFPRLRCYAYQRISRYLPTPVSFSDLKEERRSIEKGIKHPSVTTDALLYVSLEIEQAGIYSEPVSFRKTLAVLAQKAIQNGAAYASQLFFHKRKIWDPLTFEKMAVLSATIPKGRRNYVALEALVSSYSLEQLRRLNKSHPSLPPVLRQLAQCAVKDKALTEADKLFTQAIALYQYPVDVPAEALDQAALVKFQLGQYRQADERYTQAIKKYEGQVPTSTLSNAAYIKARLRQYRAADRLYTEAIEKFGEKDVPADILENAGAMKTALRRYEQADELYTQRIEKFGGKDLRVEFLVSMATTKLHIIHEIINSVDIDKPIIESLARVTVHVKSAVMEYFRDADRLYTQAIEKYASHEPAAIWLHAAYAKLGLEQYEEADRMFHRAIDNWVGPLPHYIVIEIAFTKRKLGQSEENIDEIYTKIIQKTGKAVSAFILIEAAKIKSLLGADEEADTLCQAALNKYAEGAAPAFVLATAAEARFELGQYQEAQDLVKQIIEREPEYLLALIKQTSPRASLELKTT